MIILGLPGRSTPEEKWAGFLDLTVLPELIPVKNSCIHCRGEIPRRKILGLIGALEIHRPLSHISGDFFRNLHLLLIVKRGTRVVPYFYYLAV